METITIEKTLFTFDELSQDAKETACQEVLWDEWSADIVSTCTSVLETLGFYNSTKKGLYVYFTGFSSQGDGACFEGNVSYEKGCLKKIKEEYPQWTELHSVVERYVAVQKRAFYGIKGRITQSGMYYHEHSMDFLLEDQHGNYLNDELEKEFTEVCRDLARLFYKSIEEDYEYQLSEECAKDTAEANDYKFTEDGKLYW